MEGTKSLLQSKTFWGAVLAILWFILKKFDIDLVWTEDLVNDILQVVGMLFAIYGRVVAKETIE